MDTLDCRVLAIKQKLQAQRADAIRRYERQPQPPRLLRRLSRITDEAIRALLRCFPLPQDSACIALGGYGRQEFYPHSDVDLLLLLPAATARPDEQQRIEQLVAALWDLGLKISQTVQTPAQALQLAAQDVTFQTALLEGRLLAGNRSLWQTLLQQHNEQLDPRQFYLKKVAELRARHENYQNTPYALEPNCKESPGGLRDLQLLGWLAKVTKVGKNWAEIARSGFLTAAEQKAIERVASAFMRLRIELHLLTDKAVDSLRFDLQPQLARRYGFEDEPEGRLGSELLMQRYYWASRLVTQLTTTLLQSFDEQLNPPPDSQVHEVDEDFEIAHNRLRLKHSSRLSTHPECIFRGFLHLQQHPNLDGFDAATLRSLWHGRRLIDEHFRENQRNRALFMDIIQQPARVDEVLALMNLFNILPRYIPAFRGIVGQMQHDLFHSYTVDQHTLILVRNLCRFARDPGPNDPALARQLIETMPRPWRLIIAGLFHDIAKGQGGAHEQKGAVIARAFCQQHQLSPQDTELIVFLVEHHLLLSQYAQKKDFYHPEVLQRFTGIVNSKEKLDALYLLTVADIQATNPALWTSWKGALLENLYHLARGVLQDQSLAELVLRRRRQAQHRLMPLLNQSPFALRLWQALDEEYFARHQREVILWHFAELAQAHAAPFVTIRALPLAAEMGTPWWQVMIHALDQPELFMTLCGVFEKMGMAIQDAQIYTSAQDWAIDTFVVQPTPAQLENKCAAETLRHELLTALSALGKGREEHPMRRKYHDERSRQARIFPITPKVELHALDKTRWELNIYGTDRKSLLYDIAQVFACYQLNLRSAKIMTLGERVEDSFILESGTLQDPCVRTAVSQALFNLL